MIPLQSKPRPVHVFAQSNRKRRKRFSGKLLYGVGITLFAFILIGAAAFASQHLLTSHADGYHKYQADHDVISTINGLKKISQIGSTANILGPDNKPMTVDPNPYKIAVVESNSWNGLERGDLLVSNIGNNDHGMTIVKFSDEKGTGHLFNTMRNDGTLGPAGLVFNTQTGSLWVANSTGNSVLIFHPDGKLAITIHDPLFNGPWGIATNSSNWRDDDHDAHPSFFVANKFDAKILRIDVFPQKDAAPKFKVTQIGHLDKNGALTKIDLHWLPSLKVGNKTLKDVLLAIDPVHNRIAAFTDSSSEKGTGEGTTLFQGGPLNQPGGFTINPLNGDLLVVNLNNNNLVELNLTWGKVVGVKQIDPAKVDNQGNGSALFGVVAVKDKKGNLKVFFTDDNTNTLDVLSAS
jgi:DNA-binding beta-propeller fold protein YncE